MRTRSLFENSVLGRIQTLGQWGRGNPNLDILPSPSLLLGLRRRPTPPLSPRLRTRPPIQRKHLEPSVCIPSTNVDNLRSFKKAAIGNLLAEDEIISDELFFSTFLDCNDAVSEEGKAFPDAPRTEVAWHVIATLAYGPDQALGLFYEPTHPTPSCMPSSISGSAHLIRIPSVPPVLVIRSIHSER
ncbi:hypothetical protein D9613_006465 [Agrocybe pediades]|uniref:Uncharacterized protein n=1 Tax=Agrocybe pediades TaxID=84607 RepID=A0A8H4QGP1_9AGAR|nr:hypothetical protein D9613_006465 [Agrocybe pediades]